jgi:hypothetical protein
MIVLTTTSTVLRARLAAATATAQPSYCFAWGDDGATPALGESAGALDDTTNVTLFAAPASGYKRVIRSGSIYNGDTAAVTVIVELYDGTDARGVISVSVPAGQTLFLTPSIGWQLGVTAAQGADGEDGDDGADGMPGTSLSSVNAQTGTTYALVLGDAGGLVACSNAGAVTVTIPPQSDVAWATGTIVYVEQAGAGQVTVAAGSGVTLNGAGGLLTRTQYSVMGLLRIDSDSWLCVGDAAT